MANLYSQAQQFYDTQRTGQQAEREWVTRNLNMSSQNAKQNTLTELSQLAELGSPIAMDFVKKSIANSEYQAKLSQLMNPTGLSIAKSVEGTGKTEQQLAEGASLFYNGLTYLSPEQAEKLDYSRGLRSRQIAGKQFVSSTMQGLAPFVENSIRTSNLVLRREDGSILDLSQGIHNTDDYNLVSQFFTQEYLKATGVLDLGNEFLIQEKVAENITKNLKTLNANFTTKLNQRKSLHRENEIQKELADDFTSGKPISPERWQYHFNRIGTLLNKKTGKTLTPAEMQDWIFDYGKSLAETHTGKATDFLEMLKAGQFKISGSDKLVGFSPKRLAKLDAQITDNQNDILKRIDEKNRRNNDIVSLKAKNGEYESMDDLLLDAIDKGLSSTQIETIVASSSRQIDENVDDQKAWILTGDISEDDRGRIHEKNLELFEKQLKKNDKFNQVYQKGTVAQGRFETALSSMRTRLNYGKTLPAGAQLKDLENRLQGIAKEEFIRLIKINLTDDTTIGDAVTEATNIMLGDSEKSFGIVGNPENIDQVKGNPLKPGTGLYKIYKSRLGVSHRNAVDFQTNYLQTNEIDISKEDFGIKPDDLNLDGLRSSLSSGDITDIIQLTNSDRIQGKEPEIFTVLRQQYLDTLPGLGRLKVGDIGKEKFAQFLRQVLDPTYKPKPNPYADQKKKALDDLSKIAGSERVLACYGATQRYKTPGTEVNFMTSCIEATGNPNVSNSIENLFPGLNTGEVQNVN